MVSWCSRSIAHNNVYEGLSLIRLVVGFDHQHKVGKQEAYKNYPSYISYNSSGIAEGSNTLLAAVFVDFQQLKK